MGVRELCYGALTGSLLASERIEVLKPRIASPPLPAARGYDCREPEFVHYEALALRKTTTTQNQEAPERVFPPCLISKNILAASVLARYFSDVLGTVRFWSFPPTTDPVFSETLHRPPIEDRSYDVGSFIRGASLVTGVSGDDGAKAALIICWRISLTPPTARIAFVIELFSVVNGSFPEARSMSTPTYPATNAGISEAGRRESLGC